MADLTTTPTGIWVLQALLGVEKMPTALRLRPFMPSVDAARPCATELGELPLVQTAEYARWPRPGSSTRTAASTTRCATGWQSSAGRSAKSWWSSVDPSRSTDPAARRRGRPRSEERVMSICRRDRWLAMIARSGDEVVLAPLGEAAARRRTDRVDLRHRCCTRSRAARPPRSRASTCPARRSKARSERARRQGPTAVLAVGAGPAGPVTRPGRGARRRRPRWTNRRWRSSPSSTMASRTDFIPT